MKNIMIMLALSLFAAQAFGEFTITAPASVAAQHGVEEVTSITITSDSDEDMARIRLIGMTSADSESCVKEFSTGESCSFSVAKTITGPISARIYLYPKSSSRKIHTMGYTVAESSTRDDLSSGISFINNNVETTSLDLGSITLDSIAGTRVYVRNTGSQKTSEIESIAANYTGSSAITIARDSCQGKELESNESCYFDIRFYPENAIEGANSGTFTVKASGQASGSDMAISSSLTIPGETGEAVVSNSDFLCTQTGIDESGFSAPPFCSAAGGDVETQYTASCFVNPTWCQLNTQSQNSVTAATGGDVLGFRYHRLSGATQLVSDAIVTFIPRTRIEANGFGEKQTALYAQNSQGQGDYATSPTDMNATWSIAGPYSRKSFRVYFRRGNYGNGSSLGSVLNSSGTLRYDAGDRSFDLEAGDLAMTDAQLYSKYEPEMTDCFSNGGDMFQLHQREQRSLGYLLGGTPHGEPALQIFKAYCGRGDSTLTGAANATGQLELNAELHGYADNAINSGYYLNAIHGYSAQTEWTSFEDIYDHIYSIPMLHDYGEDLEENVLMKYLEVKQYLDSF